MAGRNPTAQEAGTRRAGLHPPGSAGEDRRDGLDPPGGRGAGGLPQLLRDG